MSGASGSPSSVVRWYRAGSGCQGCLVTLKMYSSYGLRDAKGFPKLDVRRGRWGVWIPVVTGTNVDLTGTTVKYRGRGVVLGKSRGIKFCGCWGAVNTSPVLGVDSKIVWLLEGSFQLFLVGNFSSQGIRLANGKGKDVGVDKREFVVVDRNFPKLICPLVGVFFTITEDELIRSSRPGESGSGFEV